MTFIIALGVIIVLLCTASVFKLMQPREDVAKSPKKVKAQKPKRQKKSKTQKHIEPSLHQKEGSEIDVKQIVASKKEKINKVVDAAKEATKQISAQTKPPEAIVLYLCAPADKNYCGYELLQALLTAGMRFGKMNIFHRHEKKTGVGPILFSLASAEKPGTFDLAKIGCFYSKALSLFMQPSDVADPVAAYELMLETANQLIEDLGGKVLDANQKTLKKDAVIATHQRLRQYMQDKQSSDVFT